jgi:hypothetical protein
MGERGIAFNPVAQRQTRPELAGACRGKARAVIALQSHHARSIPLAGQPQG